MNNPGFTAQITGNLTWGQSNNGEAINLMISLMNMRSVAKINAALPCGPNLKFTEVVN